MTKKKATALFTSLTFVILGYVVWCLHAKPIDNDDLVFDRKLSRSSKSAARSYFVSNTPKIPFFRTDSWMERLMDPRMAKDTKILVAEIEYSDGNSFLCLFYPSGVINLQKDATQVWREVDSVDIVEPLAVPMIGRLFQ
jgi:hypothetical protein